MHMVRKYMLTLALLALALVPAQAQVSVVTVKSVDDVMADIKYVLTLAGQEDKARQLEGLIGALTAGKKLQGIDSKRPLGLYLTEFSEEQPPPFVVFVPITKEDEFIDLLKQAGVDPAKPEKGIYSLDTPLGQTLYLRFANNHAYASLQSEKVQGNLPDPAKFIPKANQNNLIAATTRLDKIPKEQKQQILEQIDKQLEEEKEKKESESDQEYQFRMAASKALRDVVAMVLEEGEQSSFAFNIDRDGGTLGAYLSVTGKPGTKLATRIKDFGPGMGNAPVHIEIAVDKLALLFLPEDGEKSADLRKMLTGGHGGQNKVKLMLQGGDSLQLRLEVSAQLIKLIATLAPQDEGN